MVNKYSKRKKKIANVNPLQKGKILSRGRPMHLLNKNAAVTVKQKPMGEDNITLPRKSVKIPATKNKTYHRTEEKQPDLKTSPPR